MVKWRWRCKVELLWTDLLNSQWHDWRGSGQSEDRLDRPDWLPKVLAARGVPAPPLVTPEVLAELRELRQVLRHMTEALMTGGAPDIADVQALNRAMAGGPVARQLAKSAGGYRLDLVPVEQGWPQVIAQIAASFAQTLAEGESARLRVCDNPDCRWFFYDDTRNRTKRFCDDKTCGNLMKVRRFRARQKAPGNND